MDGLSSSHPTSTNGYLHTKQTTLSFLKRNFLIISFLSNGLKNQDRKAISCFLGVGSYQSIHRKPKAKWSDSTQLKKCNLVFRSSVMLMFQQICSMCGFTLQYRGFVQSCTFLSLWCKWVTFNTSIDIWSLY